MNLKTLYNPKVFISYSWTNKDHEQWVLDLAERLMQDGVNVILDKWDLKEGQDTFAFMESMVRSAEKIDKVLIICDRGYKDKSNSRLGGVGTEAQIITPEIYKDVQQEKFIPIISERDDQGNHFIPTYIATRKYVDLSSEDFEENYDQLIRNIYKVPSFKKPALGLPPIHLFEEDVNHFKTTAILKLMEPVRYKHPDRLRSLWTQFSEAFVESLDQLNIRERVENEEAEVTIKNMIDKSIPLRNDYIKVMEILCVTEQITDEDIIEFFEEIYPFTKENQDSLRYADGYDQFKFLISELFLYTVTILIKSKKYSYISKLLHSEYYVRLKYRTQPTIRFTEFSFYISSLVQYNRKLELNRISVQADLLIERAIKKYATDLIDTDLFLYYVSKLDKSIKQTSNKSYWFPYTYIYFDNSNVIKILNKLKSRSHFESIKVIFNIQSREELAKEIEEFESDGGYRSGFNNIPNVTKHITSKDICTLP